MKKDKKYLENMFAWQIRVLGKLPLMESQYQFNPDRRWRADFAFVEEKILVEIEGGIWINGGHNRGARMIEDMNRQNWAVLHGWRCFRFADKHVKSGEAITIVESALNQKS